MRATLKSFGNVPKGTVGLSALASLVTVVISSMASLGCDASSGGPGASSSRTIEDFFRPSDDIVLEEREEDLIGQIGTFLETRNGELLVGDAILPRVRLYSPQGDLLAAFGTEGEGPFEFRDIGGLAQNREGRILVVDSRVARVTTFTDRLSPDTMFRPYPRPRGPIFFVGDVLLLENAPASRSTAISRVTDEGHALWSVVPPTLSTVRENPYWGSVFSMPAATSDEVLAVAVSLVYPVYLFDAGGSLIDSLTQAPRSFRTAPVVEPGALTGPGATQSLEEWFVSFDVIADLAVVADTLLVLTHGQLRTTSTALYEEEHQRFDLYHLPTRRKLAEGIDLPPGSRVLGGGRGLFLLVAEPPQPWKIVKLDPR